MQPRLFRTAVFLVVAALLSAPAVLADPSLSVRSPHDVHVPLDDAMVTDLTGWSIDASTDAARDGLADARPERSASAPHDAEDDTEDPASEPADEDRETLDETATREVQGALDDVEDAVERRIQDIEPLLMPEDDAPTDEDTPAATGDAPAPASTPASVAGPEAPTGLLVAGAVAATAVVAAAGKYGLFGRIGAALLAPLFSRFEGPSVLKHPRRAQLHGLVCKTPGITVPDLCMATGLSRNTVLHHLRMLADQDMIVEKRMGRTAHWFENGGRYGREHKAAYAVLRDDRSRDVARFVLQNPGTTQGQISRALGLAPSVIHWHMRRLEDAALVQRHKEGRTMQCFPGGPLPGLAL